MFALVDCNNFYVSCERVFNPRLVNIPVLVLSNNDGCIIARSNEAKSLGFKMGDPVFKNRDLIRKHNVAVLSSNFQLYGDMSNRVMTLLSGFSPDYEIYSIDEMFLGLEGFEKSKLNEYAKQMRHYILKSTHIPVSIGIGPTKTLAKAANFFAKRYPMLEGSYILQSGNEAMAKLCHMPVGDIWGVGRKSSEKLKSLGIHHAEQLAKSDPLMMRKKFNVVLAKIIYELRGISCFGIEEEEARKSILVSRSFGQKVESFEVLREAVAHFAANAAEKLRQQNSYAGGISIFIRTSHFNVNDAQYSNSIYLQFPKETDDSILILKTAVQGLKAIYRLGYKYKKAGVMLLELTSNQLAQEDFFIDNDKIDNKALMHVIDVINEKYGRKAIDFAICNMGKIWRGRQSIKSKAYTTNWKELLTVYAN